MACVWPDNVNGMSLPFTSRSQCVGSWLSSTRKHGSEPGATQKRHQPSHSEIGHRQKEPTDDQQNQSCQKFVIHRLFVLQYYFFPANTDIPMPLFNICQSCIRKSPIAVFLQVWQYTCSPQVFGWTTHFIRTKIWYQNFYVFLPSQKFV